MTGWLQTPKSQSNIKGRPGGAPYLLQVALNDTLKRHLPPEAYRFGVWGYCRWQYDPLGLYQSWYVAVNCFYRMGANQYVRKRHQLIARAYTFLKA
jgi:hypothetical protein